jgi:FMN-dependent NADH-azoreductase
MAQRILLITSSLFGEGGQSSALAASFKSPLKAMTSSSPSATWSSRHFRT